MNSTEVARSMEIKRQEEEKFDELKQLKHSRGTSFDYLKEKRKIKKRLIPLNHSLDLRKIIPKKGAFDYSTKRLCMERLKNFDETINLKEKRIKMQSDLNDISQETTDESNNYCTQGKLEDYYVKSIQAKLSLINEMEGFTNIGK